MKAEVNRRLAELRNSIDRERVSVYPSDIVELIDILLLDDDSTRTLAKRGERN